MLKEFKEFAIKGNLVDTAVAFVMGMAFAKVSTSFIDGMIMPIVSMLVQKDFSTWKTVLKPAVEEQGKIVTPEIAIKYGDFISSIIYFIIIAFVMFAVIKSIEAFKRKSEEQAPPPAPPASEVLLGEIRDLLKSGK